MGITTEILSSRKKKKKRKNSLLPFLPPLPQSFKRSLIRQTASRTSAILFVNTSTTLSKSGTAHANRSTGGPKSSTTWLTSSTRLTTNADSHTPNGAESDDRPRNPPIPKSSRSDSPRKTKPKQQTRSDPSSSESNRETSRTAPETECLPALSELSHKWSTKRPMESAKALNLTLPWSILT